MKYSAECSEEEGWSHLASMIYLTGQTEPAAGTPLAEAAIGIAHIFQTGSHAQIQIQIQIQIKAQIQIQIKTQIQTEIFTQI